MGQTTWTLGRHPSNLLSFPDNSISRYHAKIEVLQNRHFFLVDLNSRNGSVVNQHPVSTPVFLKHGDLISLGHQSLQFEHSLFLPQEQPTDLSQILMVHQSALQGKIWQEVLLSQNLTVCWEASAATLRHSLDQRAATQALPQALIIDIPAFKDDLEAFCRWCQQQHPTLALVLMNSQQRQIPLEERQQMIALGCLDVLPAFREPILDNVAGVVVHLNLILRVFTDKTLRQDKLFLALRKFEDLMATVAKLPVAGPVHRPVAVTSNAGVPIVPPVNQEFQDLTMITRSTR
ncbi:MAG: FHA domain-containing protein [Thermosynechococcaceae cyanobacterium]